MRQLNFSSGTCYLYPTGAGSIPVTIHSFTQPQPNHIKMAAITDSVQFPTGGQRYNFVCSKRTFAMLVSPYFDKSNENLICEEIVLKMGLPILDRKCETLSISGLKTEAVGYVKTTVQCLKNGFQNGTVYLKARVVRDFYKLFGSDGLCGEHFKNKLSSSTKATIDASAKSNDNEHKSITEPTPNVTPNIKQKKRPKILNSSSSPPDYSGSKSRSSSPSFTPPGIRTLQMSTSPWTSPTSPLLPPGFSTPFLKSRGLLITEPKSPLSPHDFSASKSPPGFPVPIFSNPSSVTLPPYLPTDPMSPFSANISRLTATFGDADMADSIGERRDILSKMDPAGTLDIASNGVSFSFYKSRDLSSSQSATSGPVYKSGHGRLWCSANCRNGDPPHNCGYHPQWHLPPGFQYCGYHCKGGLCECIRLSGYSDDYGYYG